VDVAVLVAAPDAVSLSVSLQDITNDVVGIQQDLILPDVAAIALRANGDPDCRVNPDISKEATTFAFVPGGCTPARDCRGLRVIIFSLKNIDPIADAALLYTCSVRIAGGAPPGAYPVTITNLVLADARGAALEGSAGGASIVVTALPSPTPSIDVPSLTPTALPSWTVTETPTPLPTETQQPQRPGSDIPTAVPAHGSAAASAPVPATGSGCEIAARRDVRGLWMCVLAIVPWLWRRRSRRTTRR